VLTFCIATLASSFSNGNIVPIAATVVLLADKIPGNPGKTTEMFILTLMIKEF